MHLGRWILLRVEQLFRRRKFAVWQTLLLPRNNCSRAVRLEGHHRKVARLSDVLPHHPLCHQIQIQIQRQMQRQRQIQIHLKSTRSLEALCALTSRVLASGATVTQNSVSLCLFGQEKEQEELDILGVRMARSLNCLTSLPTTQSISKISLVIKFSQQLYDGQGHIWTLSVSSMFLKFRSSKYCQYTIGCFLEGGKSNGIGNLEQGIMASE